MKRSKLLNKSSNLTTTIARQMGQSGPEWAWVWRTLSLCPSGEIDRVEHSQISVVISQLRRSTSWVIELLAPADHGVSTQRLGKRLVSPRFILLLVSLKCFHRYYACPL